MVALWFSSRRRYWICGWEWITLACRGRQNRSPFVKPQGPVSALPRHLASNTRLMAAVLNFSRILRLSAYFYSIIRSFDHSLKHKVPRRPVSYWYPGSVTIEVQPLDSWKTEVPRASSCCCCWFQGMSLVFRWKSSETHGRMFLSYDWLGKWSSARGRRSVGSALRFAYEAVPVKRIEGRRVQCPKWIASMTSATVVQSSRLSSLLDGGGVNLIRNNLWGFEYFMIISWMFSSLQNLKRQHWVQDNVFSVDTSSISSLFQSLVRYCRTAMGTVADMLGLRV